MAEQGNVSRRGFLGTAAAAATVGALSGGHRAQAEAPSATPPAIAALPVLSGQARPFTNAERLARIERAKALMAAAKIDAIVLANNTASSVYFADIRLNGGERLWALADPGQEPSHSSSAPRLKKAAHGRSSKPVRSAKMPK